MAPILIRYLTIKMFTRVKETNPNDRNYGQDVEVYSVIESYLPYFRKLTNSHQSAEDLRQDIQLKFFQLFNKDPDWWQRIENKGAFIRVAARNAAINLRRCEKTDTVSIDDDDHTELRDGLSDQGMSSFRLKREVEYEACRRRIREIAIKNFSEYEQKLIELNFFEGCKPSHIVDILLNEYPHLLEREYSKEIFDRKQSLMKFIRMDCYGACAKFHLKLRHHLRDVEGRSSDLR